jgi:pyruvate/2-oxoglutarate/acetoin dehydrogenase E1 component
MNNELYQQNLVKSMTMLGKEKNTIFLGETILYGGSPMHGSMKNVDKSKIIEVPVFENTQLGMSIGLALEGFIPVSIFPRIDFLICAMDSLINHVDKVSEMSKGEFNTGIIIRTQLGNTKPLYPGCQHCGDYTLGLKKMLKNVEVIRLKKEDDIISTYKHALQRAKKGLSTLIIESPSGVWKI